MRASCRLLFIIIIAICLAANMFAYGQGEISRTYPNVLSTVAQFDDIDPVWGPDGDTVAFERIRKGPDLARYEIGMFQPFSIVRSIARPMTYIVRSSMDDVASSEGEIYNSFFRWISIETEKNSNSRLYKYVYARKSDLCVGCVTIKSSGIGTQEGIFVSTAEAIRKAIREGKEVSKEQREAFRTGQNRYPDYSGKNNKLVFASGATGGSDIYVKQYSDDYYDKNKQSGVDYGPGERMTDKDAVEICPKWSPDGKHIAYSSRENGNMDIYVILDAWSETGGDKKSRQLSNSDLEETVPTWSPDGRMIAFYSLRSKGARSTDADEAVSGVRSGGRIGGTEKGIFDLCVVDVNKGLDSVKIVARDVYRQERRGPVWVSLPDRLGGFKQFIFYTSGKYDKIYVVNVEEALASEDEKLRSSPIEGLLGYKYGNITDLDCILYTRAENRSISGVRLAYSALAKHQKRIYWALLETETWKIKQQTEEGQN